MGYLCPHCEKGEVVYMDANNSRCRECSRTIPNAHLRSLEEYPSSQATL